MVRAKFVCSYKNSSENDISLSPVYSGSEENKAFFSATPGGRIDLFIINPEVAKQFERGKEYYVDFTPAE
jgi:hypothetical protein